MSLDDDFDGRVSIDKIKDMINSSNNEEEQKKRLKTQLDNAISLNKDVIFTHFLTIFLDKSKILTKEHVNNAFKSLDKVSISTL